MKSVVFGATIMVVALTACHRADSSRAAPAPSAIPSALAVPDGSTQIEQAMAAADLRVEPRRGAANAGDSMLTRHRAELEKHFGGRVPYPLTFQIAAIGPGRFAVLLQATEGEARPLAWLLDTAGNVLWSKEHPMGGVKPGAFEAALAPGPDGHVCLAWCNPSTDSVALRRWADDGAAFADYDALHVDGCDALSILYWPKRGWVLAVARTGGATLALIDENGERVWGNDGVSLPWIWPTAAPISLALDTLDSVMLFRLGQSGGEGTGQYVFASRWGPDGRPMWPGPLSVKRLSGAVRDTLLRIALRPVADGAIEASLPARALTAPGPETVVDVLSDGSVVRR